MTGVCRTHALFTGTCSVCRGHIEPGTLIVKLAGGWAHNTCPDPLPPAGKSEERCQKCFLIHPLGACDLE